MVHQLCFNGDIIGKQNGQCACVMRCNVLGFTNGYTVCCFDGPDDTYPNMCALFESTIEESWSLMEPNITGTISITSGTTQVDGTNTLFTSQLISGDKIILGQKQQTVDTVVNDTTLTLTAAYTGATLTNSNMWKL